MGLQTDNRDYGIDCVKVLAVVFVILHHVVDCGLTMSDNAGGALKTVWYLTHTVALTCVNLFVLVTGYLCVTSNGAHRRLLALWIQTISIGLSISAVVALAGGEVGAGDWMRSIFPVVTGEYWYFTAYVVVCLFMPFVNPGARALDRRTFTGLLAAFFLLMSASSLFTKGDPFVLKDGYSFAWLLVVYLFGAYWRLHVAKPPPLAACAAVLCTFSFVFMIPSVGKRLFSGELGAWFADFNPVRYTSPFTLMMSLAIFGLCKRIDIFTCGSSTLFSGTRSGVRVSGLLWSTGWGCSQYTQHSSHYVRSHPHGCSNPLGNVCSTESAMTAADRLSKSSIKKIGKRNCFLFSDFISIPLSRFLFIPLISYTNWLWRPGSAAQ